MSAILVEETIGALRSDWKTRLRPDRPTTGLEFDLTVNLQRNFLAGNNLNTIYIFDRNFGGAAYLGIEAENRSVSMPGWVIGH